MYRYIREAVEVLAVLAPTLDEAMNIARTKAFVILDGTLLRASPTLPGSTHDLTAARTHGIVEALATPRT